MLYLITFIFGFVTALFLFKGEIKIRITRQDGNQPEIIGVIDPKKDLAEQYEAFKKGEVDSKEVNAVAKEDKRDITDIFKLFSGGND